MVRTPSFDRNGMKKGAWSPEEDNKLRAYIQRYGHWNWRELPKYAGLSRCGKSCRLRWMNYLRPNVKRGSYTKEEEDLIIKLHEKLGNKWSLIAAKLPGRTDNEIKNHWHTNLKKRPKQNQATLELQEQALETYQSEANLELVQSLERPQSEVNQTTELASKDVADQPLPQLILESTPLSPEPSSGEISSLSTSDYPLLSDMSWVAEDSISSWESFEPIDNFWNQPFLEDVSYKQNEFSTTNLVEGGFMSPYSPYYDDGIDLFYQLLQDFSKN